ncbi:MAG: phosphate ABC transporter substrate-binding protein [Thermodesulfobacteriota bacterium]
MKFNFAFVVLLLILISSCSKKESITVSGSSTVLPVVALAAEKFTNNSGIKVVINGGGSGVGINQLGEGKIDMGMSSRDITGDEVNSYPDVNFITNSIAKDAVIPVVSTQIYEEGVQVLSLDQIGQIYKGEITNWNEIGGPDREILVVDKEASRGTRHVFMEAVFGNKNAKAPGADIVLGSNNEEQTAIAQSNAAIGMLSLAWLNDKVRGLSIAIENGKTIKPIRENVVNGTFPVVRDLILVTNGEPAGKTKEFIDYILSEEGQSIVEEAGYVRVK